MDISARLLRATLRSTVLKEILFLSMSVALADRVIVPREPMTVFSVSPLRNAEAVEWIVVLLVTAEQSAAVITITADAKIAVAVLFVKRLIFIELFLLV